MEKQMKLKTEISVLGMRRVQFTGEDGRVVSATNVYYEETLGAKDTADVRGSAVVSQRIGDASEFAKHQDAIFPHRAEVEFNESADGKGGTRREVVSYRVVSPVKKAA
jgi:hypothetical protein